MSGGWRHVRDIPSTTDRVVRVRRVDRADTAMRTRRAVRALTVLLALASPAVGGPVVSVPDRDLDITHRLAPNTARYRVLARPLDDPAALVAAPTPLASRDLEALDLLLRRPTPASSADPRVAGFGRVSPTDDPTRGDLGVGGVDLAWRPDPTLSIGVVAGGRMDAIDSNPRRSTLDRELFSPGPWPADPVPALAARATAFDGLGFGGESAAEVSPLLGDRFHQAPNSGEDLRGTFLATRAVLRPGDGTSIGLVATRGGGVDGDASLVGLDVSQTIAGQRLDAWVQQSMGASGPSDEESDRAALGASLGGALGGIRYGVGWRRIGDGFHSGLGASGVRGSHAMTGRLGWAVPLDAIPFLRTWEFGVRARFDTDLAFDPQRLEVDIDAMRLVATTGDVVEFGIRQARSTTAATFAESDLVERFRVAVATNPGRPLRLGAGVSFGDPQGATATTWQGTARWAPGGGFDLGGSLALDRTLDDRRAADTIRTAVDGGFGVGSIANVRTRLGFDAARARLTVGQSIGFDLDHSASISMAIEQEWPTVVGVEDHGVVRARVGGSFRF